MNIFKALSIFTIIGLVGLAMFSSSTTVTAKDVPLFQVGRTYGVMLGCVPVSPPCYGEKIKVTHVRDDGWIEATDLGNNSQWTYNPAQIISFMEFKDTLQAAR